MNFYKPKTVHNKSVAWFKYLAGEIHKMISKKYPYVNLSVDVQIFLM